MEDNFDEFIEKYQFEICNYCKMHITNDIAWSKGDLCYGDCDNAAESYCESTGSINYLRYQRKIKLKNLKNVISER
ncbi:hypothetical protein M0Q97_05380 [Candidatus Dojkabacteria bacterium]|jgi:hypothetical protein|nr:hypothetical protein [Candidatus Dojkabacteria bacterium]